MSKASDAFNALPFETRGILVAMSVEDRLQHLRIVRQYVVSGQKKTLREIDAWIKNLQQEVDRSEA